LRSGKIAFAGGIISVYCIGAVPSWQMLAAAALMPLLMRGVIRLRVLAPTALLFVAGLCWATWQVDGALSHPLPSSLAGRTVPVRGYVCSLIHPLTYGRIRFDLCPTAWPGRAGLARAGRLRLVAKGAGPIRAGRILQLQVQLKPPRGLVNPAGFRYGTWLFQHGYLATGRVVRGGPAPDGPGCPWQCRVQAWRQRTIRSFRRTWDRLDSRPLAGSLLFGARGELAPERWQLLRRTGTIHLVAISGLHMGLLAALLAFVTRRLLLWLAGQHLSPRWHRSLVVFVVLGGCTLYGALAGFPIATQRALVMVSVGTVAWASGRLIYPWAAWRLALCLVLLINPLAPLDAGFWLSFTAVAGLIWTFSRRLRQPHPIRALLLAQWAVGAALLPVLAVMGAPVSSLGPLANLFAIPWVSLVVMPLLVTLVPVGSLFPSLVHWFAPVIDLSVHGLWWGLGRLAGMAHPLYPGTEPLALALAAAMLVLLYPVSPGLRAASAGLLLLVLFQLRVIHPNAVVDRPRIRVFDVGEGLAVLVRSGRHALLYDTGPARARGFSTVKNILLPSLAAAGVRHLDAVVIDHGHRARDGDLPTLAVNLPVARWVAGDIQRARRRLGGNPYLADCRHARPLDWGRVRIRFWQASPDAVKGGDDRSCVVTVRTPYGSVLLPGDLKGAGERRYLRGHPDHEDFAILVAPHRGGANTSLQAWVAGTGPDWVAFSTGYGNRYGHPRQGIVDRYRQAGADVADTARDGALLFRLGPAGVSLERLRTRGPFWVKGGLP